MAIARSFRDGWLTSHKLDALRDDSAELFLFRLGLRADKNGVYHGEPELLRAAIYPLQVSRRRLADVTRYRDKCVGAGLLRLWTAADGRPYVQILNFRQKTPNERPQHPLPPGDPDETGQEHLPLGTAEPEFPTRTELNERKVCNARARRTPAEPAHTHESDEQWLRRLSEQYPGVNIEAELRRAERFVRGKRGESAKVTRRFFERDWLPKCADAVDIRAAVAPVAASTKSEAEPAGWREVIASSNYGPGGIFEVKAWGELPKDVREHVRQELLRNKAA